MVLKKPKEATVEGIASVVVDTIAYWRCYGCRLTAKDSGEVGWSPGFLDKLWDAVDGGLGEVHLLKHFEARVIMSESQMLGIELFYTAGY